MADELLRSFYARIIPVFLLANQVRVAWRSGDQFAVSVTKKFLSAADGFRDIVSQLRQHSRDEQEWGISHVVWTHGDRAGAAPVAPQWPAGIPRIQEVISAVDQVESLLSASDDLVSQNDSLPKEMAIELAGMKRDRIHHAVLLLARDLMGIKRTE